MPRLDTGTQNLPNYLGTFTSLFSRSPDQPRREIAKAVLLKSVRLRITREHRPGFDDERLEGFQGGTLPLRVRPAFVVLNVFCLLLLGILGFHPRGQAYVPINDKILHFICFLTATGLFFFIWDIDEPARRVWLWRHMPLLLTWIVCFAAGGLGSEFVQSFLPSKTFQWGDVIANFLGSGVGLFFSYHAERRYRTRREIERLYEPLDQELYYGDETEDDEEREEETGGGAANAWKSASPNRNNNNEAKRVRFGEDEILQEGSSTTTNSTKPKDTSLFQITDEEDEEGDVWRDAR